MPRIPRPRLAPAVAVGVAIALVALWLAETLPVEAGLVGWDEACFYKAAQDLYMSLAGGDVVGFLRDIRSQSFYPPGHALVSAAWFSIAGPSLWSFSLLTVLVFAAVVGLSWSVGRRLGAEWAGLAVALLVAGSPLVQVLAARPLLEVRGLALTLAFVLVFLRADGTPASGRRLTAATVVFFVTWWTKYSFGISLALALLVVHGWPALVAWRAGDRAAARTIWAPAGRVLVWGGVVPGLVWIAVIGRGVRNIRRFFVNVPNSAYADPGYWTFYVDALLHDYVVTWWLGLAVVGLAVWRASRRRALSSLERWAAAYSAVVIVLMTINRNHQARYIVTTWPFVAVLAVAGARALAGRAPAALQRWRAVALVAGLCLGLAVVGRTWAVTVATEHEVQVRDAARLGPVVARVTELALANDGVAVVGPFGPLSSWLLEATVQQARGTRVHPAVPDWWLARRPPRDPAAAFAKWVEGRPHDDIVVSVERLPGSPYARPGDDAWLDAEGWSLRYLPEAYAVIEDGIVADAGLRLRVWRRRP